MAQQYGVTLQMIIGYVSANYKNEQLVLFQMQILEAEVVFLFQQLNWMPLKNEINLTECCAVFKRLKDESLIYIHVTQLLARNVDVNINAQAGTQAIIWYARENVSSQRNRIMELSTQ